MEAPGAGTGCTCQAAAGVQRLPRTRRAADDSMAALRTGATATIEGLASRADLNGKQVTLLKLHEGRWGARLVDGSESVRIKPTNLVLLNNPGARSERTGGAWDDVSEDQVMLNLTTAERSIVTAAASEPSRATLLAQLDFRTKRGQLKLYANPPRYDRLLVCAMHNGATYIVEAGLDAWEGQGWWTTKDAIEADMKAQGLVSIDAAALAAEYSGALAFLEACKRVGGPRYSMKTDLDPDARPHVLAMVEKVIAASVLRFLLDEGTLARADAAAMPGVEALSVS